MAKNVILLSEINMFISHLVNCHQSSPASPVQCSHQSLEPVGAQLCSLVPFLHSDWLRPPALPSDWLLAHLCLCLASRCSEDLKGSCKRCRDGRATRSGHHLDPSRPLDRQSS